MTKPCHALTIDEAVGAFMALLRDGEENLLPEAGGGLPADQAGPAAAHFYLGRHLIGLACPDAAACHDQRCRRDAQCRHIVYLLDRQTTGKTNDPRRTPSAEALRYAIWVYMSSRTDR